MRSGPSERFLERLPQVTLPQVTLPQVTLPQVTLPQGLAAEVAPLVALLAPLNREIAAADHRIATLVARDAVMQRLMTIKEPDQ